MKKKSRSVCPKGRPPSRWRCWTTAPSESIANCSAGPGLQGDHLSRTTPLRRRFFPAGHHGVMLSNGPGDPADNAFCIQQIQKLFGKLPVFRHLPGPPDDGPGRRGEDQKAQVRPPRRQPAGDGPGDRRRSPSPARTTAMRSTTTPWPAPEASLRFVNVNDGTCEGARLP